MMPNIFLDNGDFSHFETYEIRLFVSYRKKISIKKVNTAKKALKYGKIIANGLDEKLLDATSKPPIFIDL